MEGIFRVDRRKQDEQNCVWNRAGLTRDLLQEEDLLQKETIERFEVGRMEFEETLSGPCSS